MIKSICIKDNILYYSEAWVGTLLSYLKFDTNFCDQAQIQCDEDRVVVIGDLAIEKCLPLIKDLVGGRDIEFIKFSDKCLFSEIKKVVNVPISNPQYDCKSFGVNNGTE